uniref:C-type lectin domain-containing protein n=1 Tax=Oryzias latipes TaxID=8090 RepID=H2MXT2_ORYLA
MTQKELSTLSSQEIGQVHLFDLIFPPLGLFEEILRFQVLLLLIKQSIISTGKKTVLLDKPCLLLFSGLSAAFVYIDKSMTWSEAQIYCREHYSDLASVRNMKDNEEITKLIPNRRNVWIGLFRDSWKWSDGSSLSFKYWSRSEPNGPTENCGAGYSSGSGTWVDISCSHKFAFICYSKSRFKSSLSVLIQND